MGQLIANPPWGGPAARVAFASVSTGGEDGFLIASTDTYRITIGRFMRLSLVALSFLTLSHASRLASVWVLLPSSVLFRAFVGKKLVFCREKSFCRNCSDEALAEERSEKYR